jgi:hypothetical protein
MTRISITAGATAGSKRRAATHYGVRDIENKLPSEFMVHESHVTQHIVFNFDDLPTNGLDEAILRIPANARIKTATLRVLVPFAGGTSYNIGLNEPDGTVIDADGIDAAIALTAIDAVGETVICDGELVQSFTIDATGGVTEAPSHLQPTIGAEDGQVVIAATGTFTAGKAALEIVYEVLVDRAVSQDV